MKHNTINNVRNIHRATALLEKMPPDEAKELLRLTDAVLSFTAYFLRRSEPKYRPEQEALSTLLQYQCDQLEDRYGNTNVAA